MASPHRSSVALTGLGLVVGAVAGWLVGLLRGPRASGGGDRV